MFYPALCIDNTTFFTNGRIKVRVFRYSGVPLFDKKGHPTHYDDLKTDSKLRNTQDSKGYTSKTEDFDALVYAPLGGGRSYGMFMLPQINSKGLITFLEDDKCKALWVGSYFDNMYADDGTRSGNINIPGDTINAEGQDVDGVIDKKKTYFGGDESTMVLRTRSTTNSDDGVDWEKQRTENLIVLDKNRVRMRHYSQWNDKTNEKYQEIVVFKDSDNNDKETVQIDVNNTKDNKRGLLRLTEDGLSITLVSGGDSDYSIYTKDDGLHIKTKVSNKKIYLNGEDGTIVSLVTYDQLKTIVEAFEGHIHYGETNSLKTTAPYASDNSPITTKVDQPKTKMEAENIKTKEHA